MKITPRKLILDLLLAENGASLSAKDAVGACVLFELGEVSARVTLTRLLAEGLAESTGRGLYKLGPKAMEVAGEIATWRTANYQVRPWHGDYITVHTGSLGRTDRTALIRRERALKFLGFRELEKGLYIRPNNIAADVNAVRIRLRKLGLENDALICVSSDFEEASKTRIKALWDCVGLAKNYEAIKKQLQDWMANVDQLELGVAAQESLVLGSAAIHDVVFDPLLPAPFVDVAAREQFVDVVREFDRVGHAIWKKLRQSNFMV